MECTRLHSDRFGVFISSYTIFQAFRTWNSVLAKINGNLWKIWWKFRTENKKYKICSYCGLLSFDVVYNVYKVIKSGNEWHAGVDRRGFGTKQWRSKDVPAHGQWTLRGPSPYFITFLHWPLPHIHLYSNFAHVYLYYMILNTARFDQYIFHGVFWKFGSLWWRDGGNGVSWWRNDKCNPLITWWEIGGHNGAS